MKTEYKRAISILLLLFTITMFSSATKSPYYAKSVVITKIYPHKLGYRVLYTSNSLDVKEAYLPSEMFLQQEEGKERSRIFSGYDKSYPYMTIFWRDGEFSHVKLYVKEGYNDVTWGALNNPDAHDEMFRNAELKFDF